MFRVFFSAQRAMGSDRYLAAGYWNATGFNIIGIEVHLYGIIPHGLPGSSDVWCTVAYGCSNVYSPWLLNRYHRANSNRHVEILIIRSRPG